MNIPYEELDYSDNCEYLFEGERFTGIAEERFSNGKLRCVFPFRAGKEHGDVKEYFPSGELMTCTPYIDGVVHGKDLEWFENGRVRVERDVEFGILMRSRTFDASGTLVDEYVRPPDGLREIAFLKRMRPQ